MRKLVLSLVASAAIAGACLPSSANAAAGSLPAIQPIISDSIMLDQVQHWRRGSRGGHWRWGSRGGGHWRYGSRGGGHWRYGSRGGRRW